MTDSPKAKSSRPVNTAGKQGDYLDVATVRLHDHVTRAPLALYVALTRPVPLGLNAALTLRNLLVRPFGIRAVPGFGAIPVAQPEIGGTLDLFTIKQVSPNTMVIGIDDIHLDVELSFSVTNADTGATFVMTTTVVTHNLTGRIYMLFVGPFHRILVRHMIRRSQMGTLCRP